MAFLDDVATLLSGVGAPVQKGRLQATPDAVVALLETAPFPPERGMGAGSAGVIAEMPGLQVIARAATYPAARALAVAALAALDGYGPAVINGVRYDAISALQRPPYPIGPDANDREQFVFNAIVTRGATT